MQSVEVIPCLEDNYAYLITDEKNNAVLVDAPEAAPIKARIDALGLKIDAALITHHHDDHVAGLSKLDISYAPVYGAETDRTRLPSVGVHIKSDEKFKVDKMHFSTMPADGHTIGHIAYYLADANALFTGDSLMFWGCGRLFEGKPEDMWATLESFMALPPETLIYSGHNYGEVNGRFALSLGGYTKRMEARLEKVRAQNAKGEPVVPVSLKEEMETNPFLLARDDGYAKELGIEDMTPLERFTHIRKLRDVFSG